MQVASRSKIIGSQIVVFTNRRHHVRAALWKPRTCLSEISADTVQYYHSCEARRQLYARDRKTMGNQSYTRGLILTPPLLFLYRG